MARTSELYAKEGYGEKVIALPAFHKIVSAASSVGLQLQKGDDGDLVDTHAVLDLLKRLNAINSGSDFIYALTAWRRIADEAFIVRQPFGSAGKLAKGKPTQLWLLEPHRVHIKQGIFGMPVSYEYQTAGADKLAFPVDQSTGQSDVLHLRNFNPLHASRGLSPMSAAAYSIDTHNSAMRWNKALLENSARPSGALVMKSKDGAGSAPLGDEQYARLKEQMNEDMVVAANASKPLLLEGGLEWQALGLTPAEMDFNKGIWMSATQTCPAFQTPTRPPSSAQPNWSISTMRLVRSR
jgi:HK97 family phage portal protein